MKALVLAGGTGTRLRPLSHTMPKQLIPVGNVPVLERVLWQLRDLGVRDVCMVVGGHSGQVRAAVGDGSRLGLQVTYVQQPRPLGLAHCVKLARPFLGEDDFVMYLGDVLLLDDLTPIGDEFRRKRPAALGVVQKVSDPSQYGIAEVDGNGAVRGLVEKPEHPRSDLALVGVYFFTSEIHRAVAALTPSRRGELEITDAIQWLLTHGLPVEVARYEGFWRDTGRPGDVLDCNRRVLADLSPMRAGSVDAASRMTGPVVLEEGAQVIRSEVQGPVVIGAGSVVSDSRIGPNVSVGNGCQITGSAVTDSIVMDGASIQQVDGLSDSIVGRGAVVRRQASDSRHRMVIADDTWMELAACGSS